MKFQRIAVTNRKIFEKSYFACLGTMPDRQDFLRHLRRILPQVDFLVLREKDMEEAAYEALAAEVFALCREMGTPFAVHQFAGVAKRIGCRRLHLSLRDAVQAAGQEQRPVMRLGCSVHSVEEARRAEALGADYVFAGHIFPTDCKKDLPPRGLIFLEEVQKAVSIPVYALGGINEETEPLVKERRAAGACRMSDYMRYRRAWIISGGEECPVAPLPPDAFVVACDKGALYAHQQNIVPDLVLGDFDSLPGGVEGLKELFGWKNSDFGIGVLEDAGETGAFGVETSEAVPVTGSLEEISEAVPATGTTEKLSEAVPAFKTPEKISEAVPAFKTPEKISEAVPETKTPEEILKAVPATEALKETSEKTSEYSITETPKEASKIRSSKESRKRRIPKIETVPAEKDDTDTMLAARRVAELGFDEVTVCCCLGGRIDHMFANIQTAAFLAAEGLRVHLKGNDCDIYCVKNGGIILEPQAGCALSVFSLSEEARGVSLRGVRYPLEQAVLTNTFPIGISNAWAGERAEISVEEGMLAVMVCKAP